MHPLPEPLCALISFCSVHFARSVDQDTPACAIQLGLRHLAPGPHHAHPYRFRWGGEDLFGAVLGIKPTRRLNFTRGAHPL